jgi:beta-lactamase superfamily II metal-dependent hydrolase
MEGEQRDFWQQDAIQILAPNTKLISEASEPNGMSYVLFIKYGSRKIVLGGDANEKVWEYLIKKYPEELKQITVLKASHHGRDTGYHQEAVKLMSPQVTVVSVGKKPETDASQKYNQYSNKVLSTRWNGNVVFIFNDDGTVNYSTEFERN